ncbi:MAG: hypothetical protein GYB37_04775 [Algicola sp.]|nr:hypothetical protein [Algicola sp.]
MRKLFEDRTKLQIYLPPLFAAVVICIIENNIFLLYLAYLISLVVWLITLPILWLLFESLKRQKLDKELAVKVKSNLNIDDKEWKKISYPNQLKMFNYSQKKDRYIKNIVTDIYYERKESGEDHSNIDVDNIKLKVETDWQKLSLEAKIKCIEDYELKKEKDNQIWKQKAEKWRIHLKELEEKSEKERLLRENEEDLKRLAREQKELEAKALQDKLEEEKQKQLEEIKKNQLIIEQKKQKDKEYKEHVKLELLEKERKKQLESEAIQELIEQGKLSENYSQKNYRTPIPSHVKQAVWKRDKQCCVSCGSQENLEFDHNIPVSKGGSNSINNIQLLCQNCNRKKSNRIV